MKIAFITRSTLYKVHGGDTIQISETAKCLERIGVSVSIYRTNEKIDYEQFNLSLFQYHKTCRYIISYKKDKKTFCAFPYFNRS